MNILIVVAHPDDEVLGCGIVGAALSSSGHSVRSCFLCGRAEARSGLPDGDQLQDDARRAQLILGFGEPIFGAFPNIRLNLVAHLDLVKFIESALVESNADVIFTHHPADLNDDHLHTSRACQAAARLFQRRPDVKRLRRLYYCEILSSTDWAFPGGLPEFRPDTFVSAAGLLDKKIEALHAYRGVLRASPHSRSERVLRSLACYRGAQAGLEGAEAFQTAFSAGTAAEIFGQ